MVAVDDENATRQFFVEALRQSTKTTEALIARIEKMDGNLQDVRERVIRIEANQLDRQVHKIAEDVAALEKRVDTLEKAEDVRDGQVRAANAAHKWAPTVVAVLLILIALVMTGVVK